MANIGENNFLRVRVSPGSLRSFFRLPGIYPQFFKLCKYTICKLYNCILVFRPESDYLFICLLYTSDAADERSSVDLGGRRIIKKKKKNFFFFFKQKTAYDISACLVGSEMCIRDSNL